MSDMLKLRPPPDKAVDVVAWAAYMETAKRLRKVLKFSFENGANAVICRLSLSMISILWAS